MTNTDAGIRPEYVGTKNPAILRSEIQRIFDLQPQRPGRPNAEDFAYWTGEVVKSSNGWDSYWVFNKMLAGIDLSTLKELVPFPMPAAPDQKPPDTLVPDSLVGLFLKRLDQIDAAIGTLRGELASMRLVQAKGLVVPYLGTALPPK